MSRQPSWASFTRPIESTKQVTTPSTTAAPAYHQRTNYPYHPQQPTTTSAYSYPAVHANGGQQGTPGYPPVAAAAEDPDASIRGILADILGGGDGTNATPIPASQPLSFQLNPSAGYFPQVPPNSYAPQYAAAAPSMQPPPLQPPPMQPPPMLPPPMFVPPNPRPNGRQLITLSGPNLVPPPFLNNKNNINNNNNNGVPHLQHQPTASSFLPASTPSSSPMTPLMTLSNDVTTSVLRPGVKRKPDDIVSPPSQNVGATIDEEYKKSTKHFLYHCDVCNFTCQGPGIYYHIVSPKHKNSCQKQGRAFVEPKGVLVGAKGPARDSGTGQEYERVGEKQARPATTITAGADPLEEDEGPYVEFYNFCKSLQIPSDLIPTQELLASYRHAVAEPEPKNAQLAKLVSSIRASAAVVEETTKTTSRNFRYWVSTFKEQQKEKEMKKVLAIKGSEPFHFKIVNYNVLAQAMMTEQSYNFQQHKPEHLTWEHRSQCIQEEIDYIGDPEIICLQEVASDVYSSFFVPLLEMRGYLGMFRARQSGVAEGCAIFVRLDKFRFIDAHPVSLKRDVSILDRDNVGLMIKVKPIVSRPRNVSVEKWKEPDVNLCIVTTQLIFSAQRGDTKLAQLGLLFAEMDKFCRRPDSESSYHPTIFCGDFNALPYSQLYKFVQGKRLKYNGLQPDEVSGQKNMFIKERKSFLSKPLFPSEVGVTENCQYGTTEGEPTGELTHSFKFVTVYKHEISGRERDPNDEGEIEITSIDNREISTQIKGFSTCTDYMFYSVDGFKVNHNLQTGRLIPQDVLEGSLRIIARHRIPVFSEMKDIGLIPNSSDGSDHFPMAAEFLLNPWTFNR